MKTETVEGWVILFLNGLKSRVLPREEKEQFVGFWKVY